MSSSAPIIGITCQRYKGEPEHSVHGGYIQSVEEAGGVPLVIPMTRQVATLARFCDGFVLVGSVADVNPMLYGVTPPPNNYSDLDRDQVDYEIMEHAEATGKPVFGICRGCQIMNVFRGGSLSLHYSEQVQTDTEHSSPDYSGPLVHPVHLRSDSALGRYIETHLGTTESIPVNSIHRQVVKELGTNLGVAAVSHDGLVEAIEDRDRPDQYFAVQWHPERAPNMQRDDMSRLLFRRLIEAALKRKTSLT